MNEESKVIKSEIRKKLIEINLLIDDLEVINRRQGVNVYIKRNSNKRFTVVININKSGQKTI